jgi:8-oxo-dGTP diphosphatase
MTKSEETTPAHAEAVKSIRSVVENKYMSENKPRVGIGVGIALIKNNKVLLGKRNSNPEKADSELHGEGTWTMPGGKVEFGESFEKTAIRELFEETGIEASEKDMNVICVNNDMKDDAHFVTIGFRCKKWKGDPRVMEPDEIVEWQWFSLNKLTKPIFFPSKKVLNNIRKKKFYIK